jgi:hypothetical protein
MPETLLVRPVQPVEPSGKRAGFRWWFLIYLLVQNAIIIGALDWFFSWLLKGNWPVASTYFLVGAIVILTAIGYIWPPSPKLQIAPDLEIVFSQEALTLNHFHQPPDITGWREIAQIQWQEGNVPPFAVIYLFPDSPAFIGRANAGRPLFVVLELIGFDKPPLEIYRQLDYYWHKYREYRELTDDYQTR